MIAVFLIENSRGDIIDLTAKTLVPVKGCSKGSGKVFIRGDVLDSLGILRNSCRGKVDVIYLHLASMFSWLNLLFPLISLSANLLSNSGVTVILIVRLIESLK